jgi:hypothetical protein
MALVLFCGKEGVLDMLLSCGCCLGVAASKVQVPAGTAYFCTIILKKVCHYY